MIETPQRQEIPTPRPRRLVTGASLALAIILLAGVSARLYKITNPLLDHHSWRQSDTASIARNFTRFGMNLFRPQVDYRIDEEGGLVESEFQLYPYMVALIYTALGEVDTLWGRLLSVLFYILASLMLYRLALFLHGPLPALGAVLFYSLAPLNIFFTRTFQPESLMLFLSIGAMDGVVRWLEGGRWRHLWQGALLGALALLVKIPMLLLGLPLGYLILQRHGLRALWRPKVYLLALVMLLPATLWYLHAATFPVTFGIWNGEAQKWFDIHHWMDPRFYKVVFYQRFSEFILTWPGLVLCLGGFLLPQGRRRDYFAQIWLMAAILFIFIATVGNWTHIYYQLPLLPPASLLVGRALAHLAGWRGLVVHREPPQGRGVGLGMVLAGAMVAVLIIFSWWNLTHFREENDHFDPYGLELPIAQQAALLRSFNDHKGYLLTTLFHPSLLYQADRRGWEVSPRDLEPAIIERRRAQGATLLLISPQNLQELADARPWLGRYLLTCFTLLETRPDLLLFSLAPGATSFSGVVRLEAEHFRLATGRVEEVEGASGGAVVVMDKDARRGPALHDLPRWYPPGRYRLRVTVRSDGRTVPRSVAKVQAIANPQGVEDPQGPEEEVASLTIASEALADGAYGRLEMPFTLERARGVSFRFFFEKALPLWLDSLVVEPLEPSPEPDIPLALGVRLGGEILLEGARFETRTVRAGDILRFDLLLKARSRPRLDYRLLVHLDVLPYAPLILDQEPALGLLPATTWGADETITVPVAVRLPRTVRSGTYLLSVGLYDRADGLRLAVEGPDSLVDRQDRVLVGEITVVRRAGGGRWR